MAEAWESGRETFPVGIIGGDIPLVGLEECGIVRGGFLVW
jgi:hypothetical protein